MAFVNDNLREARKLINDAMEELKCALLVEEKDPGACREYKDLYNIQDNLVGICEQLSYDGYGNREIEVK